MGHRHGESRDQAALFPVLLDDLVEPDSLVRVIDAVGNMTAMWFSDIDTEAAVAPSLFQFHVPPGVEVMAPPVFPGPR